MYSCTCTYLDFLHTYGEWLTPHQPPPLGYTTVHGNNFMIHLITILIIAHYGMEQVWYNGMKQLRYNGMEQLWNWYKTKPAHWNRTPWVRLQPYLENLSADKGNLQLIQSSRESYKDNVLYSAIPTLAWTTHIGPANTQLLRLADSLISWLFFFFFFCCGFVYYFHWKVIVILLVISHI